MIPTMSTLKALAVAAFCTTAMADLVVNNHCQETIHMDQIPPGTPDGLPSYDIGPGDSVTEPIYGEGIAVKLSREDRPGVLQLEYSLADHFYWDLSDIDGGGPGVSEGTFRDVDVKVTPTGNGAGEGENKCYTLVCPAGQTCQEAYQEPDQEATRVCPADTGDLILDLCSLGGVEAPSSGGSSSGGGYEEGQDEEEYEEEEYDWEEEDDDEDDGGRWGRGRGLGRKMTHGRRI